MSHDPIGESIAQTHVCGTLQIRGHSVTRERERVAQLLEGSGKAWQFKEIQKETQLPQKSLRRILELFRAEKLIHYSADKKAYFRCQKPYQRRKTSCHSFGICERCHAVREFVHEKHAHPRFTFMKVVGREHEWITLCLTCKK